MGETARRDLQAERGPQQVRHLPQRHPQLRVQLDDQRHDPGTELHARCAQRVGGLQNVAALNPLPTLRAVADLNVEAPHHRTHRRQFLLVLRRHAGYFDRATAVRTRRRNRRRVHLVDSRREPTAAVTAILRTGPPSGTLPFPLRSVLGKRRRLPATRPACLVQLSFQTLVLLLQAVILSLQAAALALQPRLLALQSLGVPLPPGQLFLKPFEVAVQILNAGRLPVDGRHAIVMPYSAKLYKSKS